MRRKLFNVAAAVSLVLCAATLAWWVRSCWVSETIGRVGEVNVVVLDSVSGTLCLGVTRADPENEEPGPRPYYVWHTAPARTSSPGIVSGGTLVRFGARVRMSGFGWVVVPHWVLVLTTLPGACLSLGRMRRSILAKVRRNYGHCPACGYDLRATPDRCPECGAVSEAPTAAAA
ncbi:MAG: hypothetical protein QOE14_1695 [Humisphaera sp.]|nr:hypothetical protein [Humisphaera sp.]